MRSFFIDNSLVDLPGQTQGLMTAYLRHPVLFQSSKKGSSIVVFIFGGMLVSNFLPLSSHPWLIVKLIFVAGLYVYQNYLHQIYKQQQLGIIKYSPLSLRIINEVSTIFLVAIVFLVVLKSVVNMFYGLFGLVLFIFLLLAGIKIYKNIREKNDNKK